MGGVKLPEPWTGRLIGRMHNNDITMTELAKRMGVTRTYVSLLLSSKRKPPGIRERMESTVAQMIEERKQQ